MGREGLKKINYTYAIPEETIEAHFKHIKN